MSHFHRPLPCLLLLAVTAAAPAAHAERPMFEVTPFGGYRMGGSFDTQETATEASRSVDLEDGGSWGVDLGIYRDPGSFYELLYSTQSVDLDSSDAGYQGVEVTTDYIHFGGTLLFADEYWVVPYFSFTAGATLFNANGGYDSDTKFSFSMGTGLRLPFTEHLSATLGVRGYLTFVSSDGDLFCVSNPQAGQSGCLLKTSGDTFFQGEATAGLTLRF
jgi:opacity protein-like surface antigen